MLAQKEATIGIRTFLEEFSMTFGEMTEKATSLNNQATIAVELADESIEAARSGIHGKGFAAVNFSFYCMTKG